MFKSDTPQNPTHVIALNLSGKVEIIVLPKGDEQNAKIFIGPKIYASQASLVPVTVSFKDVDGSGRLAMLLHVEDQTIVYPNSGSEFIAPKQ